MPVLGGLDGATSAASAIFHHEGTKDTKAFLFFVPKLVGMDGPTLGHGFWRLSL
jgi:hypothetical protein